MNPDEIYLANFPFGGSVGMKLRPVLLLTGPVGNVPEVLVAYISSVLPSSVLPSSLLPSDLVLDPARAELNSTNLKTKSVVRLHKLATIHSRNIIRHLGVLSPSMQAAVDDRLRTFLSL